MAAAAGTKAETRRNSTRTAVAYYRTSSAANVGPDKDSLARQREAVTGGFWNEAQRVKRSGFGRLCQAP